MQAVSGELLIRLKELPVVVVFLFQFAFQQRQMLYSMGNPLQLDKSLKHQIMNCFQQTVIHLLEPRKLENARHLVQNFMI